MSQQAAEKALKAVLKHFDENTFGHDLRELVARPEGYSRVSKEVRRPRGHRQIVSTILRPRGR